MRMFMATPAPLSLKVLLIGCSTSTPGPPVRDMDQIGYTFDEVTAFNLESSFPSDIEEAREDVESLDLAEIAKAWTAASKE